MGDEDDKKPSQQSIAIRSYWEKQNSLTEAEKIAAKVLREERIEHIASIMREFVDKKTGELLWTRKVRLALGREWGLTDDQTQKLSGEAHRRVSSEVDNPEEIRRSSGVALIDCLASAYQRKDHKSVAALITVGLKMADRVQKIEVTVEAKQPTPADAARAVAEICGTKVSNFDDTEKDEPAGDVEPAGDSSED